MIHWLRWGWPRRRLLKLSVLIWPNDSPQWLLDWFYPDDAEVTFK